MQVLTAHHRHGKVAIVFAVKSESELVLFELVYVVASCDTFSQLIRGSLVPHLTEIGDLGYLGIGRDQGP